MSELGSSRLVRAGGGEMIAAGASRTVRIVADHPDLAMTCNRFAPGERGSPLHVHRGHADAWWVIEGELTLAIGSPAACEVAIVPAGAFALVPPMLPHMVENCGAGDVRFLNFHAPGAGFAEYLRGRRDGRPLDAIGFDQVEPPAEGCLGASAAVIRDGGVGLALELAPGHGTVIKCGGADGAGSLTVAETMLPPHYGGPPPHIHHQIVDAFWVLEGTLDLRLGVEWVKAVAGDFALVPPGDVHTIANRGATPVRLLNVAVPGGYERYLIEVAAARTAGAAVDPARLAEAAARYDFTPAV